MTAVPRRLVTTDDPHEGDEMSQVIDDRGNARPAPGLPEPPFPGPLRNGGG